ncbi:MAG: hypothetical protein ACAH80_03900 [Alphaproteobacteria bacterium]
MGITSLVSKNLGPKARKALFFLSALAVAGLLAAATVKPARSQFCETDPQVIAAMTAAITANTTALNAAFLAPVGALPLAYQGIITAGQATLILALEAMQTAILTKLAWFWDKWLEAWQDMTKQLSGSTSEGSRKLGFLFDSDDIGENSRDIQETEIDAKKQYQTTDQTCRFDTTARGMNSAMRTGKFVSQGLAEDANTNGNNKTGSIGEQGPPTFANGRFREYVQNFCDPADNDNTAGCPAGTPGFIPGGDVNAGRTIFSRETIDTVPMIVSANEAQANRLAMQHLTYNLTGFDIPAPFKQQVLNTPEGVEQRMQNREYLAQMDAVTALVTSLFGERTPGQASPQVQQLRQKLGVTDASPRASERELRQSVIEQLWDPNYYVELGDSEGATQQKEVYLQAYNLMMLYKMIEKTEKIATVYAIQTANMLEQKHGQAKQGGEQWRNQE